MHSLVEGQSDLVAIEFHPGMTPVQQSDFFNLSPLMIHKYLNIKPIKEVQIYLVLVIADGSDEGSVLIERRDFPVQRTVDKFQWGGIHPLFQFLIEKFDGPAPGKLGSRFIIARGSSVIMKGMLCVFIHVQCITLA